ncbi:hypothetical protein MKW98_009277 [Papaver atlanticum]|uniref:Uncharacterized protein n=1 Tax=Papaver atlanticum TaxID=357466 RepID=A0AAD4XMN4_9MAGN|nr:hypothetical protein MKW98_009277 [Papaver atlanticum]
MYQVLIIPHLPTLSRISFYLDSVSMASKKMEMSGQIETMNKGTYELPTGFEAVFGKSIKQNEAEEATHELYCKRAQIKDGQTFLDIGCGQGGLLLYIAQKYKNCHVTGLTNSTAKVSYLLKQAEKLRLTNVDAILADVTQYESDKTYDRLLMIVAIEHMKTIRLFMKKLSTWMPEDSLLFADHISCLQAVGEDDWYSDFIFPPGCVTKLAANSLIYFQDDVSVVDHWVVNGVHMARSVDIWRKTLDKIKEAAKEILLPGLGGSHEAGNKVVTHIRTFVWEGANNSQWIT